MARKKRSPGAELPGFEDKKPMGTPVPTEPELQRAIAAFDTRFQAAYASRPTWGLKQGAQLKRLIAAHGVDEVLARIGRLFDGHIAWPPPPYDLGALVAHFDKLVGSSARKLRPSEILGGGQ